MPLDQSEKRLQPKGLRNLIKTILTFIISALLISLIFFSALKIHVGPSTKEVLDTFKTFILELRGPVDIKVCSISVAKGIRKDAFQLEESFSE